MSIIKLIKVFRANQNTVKVLYFHRVRHQEFLIEWNNIHPSTGDVGQYDLEISCMSNDEILNLIVEDTIQAGESDDNDDCDLYIELRDTFDYSDCVEV